MPDGTGRPMKPPPMTGSTMATPILPKLPRFHLIAVTVFVTGMIGPAPSPPAAAQSPCSTPLTDPQTDHLQRDNPSAAALAKALGPGFSVYRTDHFAIASNVDRQLTLAAGRTLEQTARCVRAFLAAHHLSIARIDHPWQAVFAGKWTDLASLPACAGPRTPGQTGFFDPASQRSYFVTTASLSHPSETATAQLARQANLLTVAHEAAHQVLAALNPRLSANAPHWLAEGFACMFELPCPTGSDFRIADNPWRAADALADAASQPADAGHPTLNALVSKRWPELLASGAAESQLYARSWSLVYYLHTRRRDPFTQYLRAIEAMDTPHYARRQADLFRSHLGPPDDKMARSVIRLLRQDP